MDCGAVVTVDMLGFTPGRDDMVGWLLNGGPGLTIPGTGGVGGWGGCQVSSVDHPSLGLSNKYKLSPTTSNRTSHFTLTSHKLPPFPRQRLGSHVP